MKKILSALAAVVLAFLLVAPPAEARCWSNGHRWSCSHYRHHHARYWQPYRYAYYPYGYYYRPYYRPRYYAYACVWPFCW